MCYCNSGYVRWKSYTWFCRSCTLHWVIIFVPWKPKENSRETHNEYALTVNLWNHALLILRNFVEPHLTVWKHKEMIIVALFQQYPSWQLYAVELENAVHSLSVTRIFIIVGTKKLSSCSEYLKCINQALTDAREKFCPLVVTDRP